MNSLMALSIWHKWSHEDEPQLCRKVEGWKWYEDLPKTGAGLPTAEDLLIHRQLCHLAIVEHVASPGEDAFMPGSECTEVYVLEQGISASQGLKGSPSEREKSLRPPKSIGSQEGFEGFKRLSTRAV